MREEGQFRYGMNKYGENILAKSVSWPSVSTIVPSRLSTKPASKLWKADVRSRRAQATESDKEPHSPASEAIKTGCL